MPSPKSGSAGTLVAPADPAVAHDADVANPGEVEKAKEAQRETKTGKYGSKDITPYSPSRAATDNSQSDEERKKKVWITIKLVDAKGNPVPGEPYELTLPDGTVKTGTLDAKGMERVSGIDPGSCKVTFPRFDKEAWSPH